MSKKKKPKKIKPTQVQTLLEENPPQRNSTLVLGGVIVAMGSIGLLIFVLSEKVFHLS